jgi:lysophospholipase L1-like esterase
MRSGPTPIRIHASRRIIAKLVVLACLGAICLSAASQTAQSRPGDRWVTAWEAAPGGSDGLPAGVEPQGFADQTLRLIVTPHAAGASVRVVLSNLFGAKTIMIRAATIAIRARGAALERSTLRDLRFEGRRTVRIRAGHQVLSDPAPLQIRPFEDLAVSLAFGPPTGPATSHGNGLQTSYMSATGSGNHTTAIGARPFTASWPVRFFLTGVHVLAGPRARTLVAVGDSITDGGDYEADTVNKNSRWPDFLQRRLLAAHSQLSVANAAISANQLTHDAGVLADAGPSLEHRFRRDVLSQPNLAGIILLEGINDIGLSDTSARRLIAGMKTIAHRAHAAGVPIMIGTLLPFGGVRGGYETSAKERTRRQVNQWILRQHVFDAVINFAAAVRDPSHSLRLLPRYDSGDHLHPNAKGFRAMAAAINLKLVQRLFAGKR